MAIDLTWKSQDGNHVLIRQGSKVPVISVVPDKVYPCMWRIQSKTSALSDMVNLSRAKDAAFAIAMSEYRQETKLERPTGRALSDYSVPEGVRYPLTQSGLTQPSSAAHA